MLKLGKVVSLIAILLGFIYCSKKEITIINTPSGDNEESSIICGKLEYNYENQTGCDGKVYPNPENSPYIIPLEKGIEFTTGLTNCSSSYHSSGRPDQYAFDFDLPERTEFRAARGGIVHSVEESQSSFGGGAGNSVIINHGNGTFGIYLHSPQNGILVEPGDSVNQHQVLGLIGRSGLAGYPHLHFIVVEGDPMYPYKGIPITFNNASPTDIVLESNKLYKACGG